MKTDTKKALKGSGAGSPTPTASKPTAPKKTATKKKPVKKPDPPHGGAARPSCQLP